MPVPIPGLKIKSDNQKVKFLTIFGRPKTPPILSLGPEDEIPGVCRG